jgi:pimeloyl-ACP methyl ester carboxylesterase
MDYPRLLVGQVNMELPTQARIAALQYLISAPSKAQMDAFVSRDLGPLIRSDYWYEVAGANPDAYSCITATDQLILIRGIENQRQGQAVVDGYTGSNPLGNKPESRHHAYAKRWATGIYDNVKDVFRGGPTPIVGYSFGGLVAWYLAELFLEVAEDGSVPWIVGIGAPKIPRRLVELIGNKVDPYALVNDDDPVPVMPPTLTAWQRFMAGLSIYQYQNCEDFQSWPLGSILTADAVLRQGTQPTSFVGPAMTELASWLARANAGLLTPHSISVYAARLAATLPPTVTTVTVAPSGPPATPDPVTPPAIIRRTVADQQQTSFTDGNRQNAIPVQIPDHQLFTVARQGKIWSVYFGGTLIATAPKKRRARALKNEGNAFIRRLQNEGVVFTEALAATWAEYLAAASDPNSGFVPQLNTTPP